MFVPSDSYLTAYDDIRRAFRENWKPVQVFCAVSVDTVASWCLLQTCFQEDLILYELHVVNTEDDIQSTLASQDAFVGDVNGLQLIFLNCGASMNALALMEEENVTIHILDGHGPVSLDLLMSPHTLNLHVWDAGNTQSYIETFFQSVVDDREGEDSGETNRRKRKNSSKKKEAVKNRSQETGTSVAPPDLASIVLTPEEKLSYYSISCTNETPSFFVFSILAQMRVRIEDEVIWYRTIALTDFFFQHILSSPECAQRMKKLHETVTVNQRNKGRFRVVSAPNAGNVESLESSMVGSYHTMQIEKNVDTPLVLLHHWTLWDAVRNSSFVSKRLRLFEGQTLCKQRILDTFAFLGITHKESNSKWTELPASRREEIQRLILTEKIINDQPLCASYQSISKRHGYGYICGAMDMVRMLQHILTETSGQTKATPSVAYDTRTHRNNFFTAIDALRSKSMTEIAVPMTRCCRFYTRIVEMADAAHQNNSIKSAKTFDYLLLQDEDLSSDCLHPITLRILAQYLMYLPVQRKSQKAKRVMFIMGALDRAADEYIFVGVGEGNESPARSPGDTNRQSAVGFIFWKLALKYHEILKHNGIDKDWIRVGRAHGLHLLDAIHIELLGLKREVT